MSDLGCSTGPNTGSLFHGRQSVYCPQALPHPRLQAAHVSSVSGGRRGGGLVPAGPGAWAGRWQERRWDPGFPPGLPLSAQMGVGSLSRDQHRNSTPLLQVEKVGLESEPKPLGSPLGKLSLEKTQAAQPESQGLGARETLVCTRSCTSSSRPVGVYHGAGVSGASPTRWPAPRTLGPLKGLGWGAATGHVSPLSSELSRRARGTCPGTRRQR